jgi:hypothetical protein
MIELDHASLDRLLPATAGSPDWDDVLSRSDQARSRRRRRAVFLVAVVALVAVGTATAFGVRAVVLHSGSTDVPPKGAGPSRPVAGKLVVAYGGRPELSGFPDRFVPVSQVWVYADGRVIKRRESPTFPYGVDVTDGKVRTGLLEQRLTAEGVELLRSALDSTGLFERDLLLRAYHGLTWGAIQVRDGSRLVTVEWCCSPFPTPRSFADQATFPTEEQAKALAGATELLADPASSLPASAWADPEPRGYVPSRYAICHWPDPYSRPAEPTRVLEVLPGAAQDILRGKGRTYHVFSAGVAVVCSDVTTAEARELQEIFGRAGFTRVQEAWTHGFRVSSGGRGLGTISFEPLLPHGRWEAMGG